MSEPGLLLLLLDFTFVGLLPKVFFRKGGSLGPMWWVTAFPFFVCPIVLVVAFAMDLRPIVPEGWTRALEPVAVAPASASIALIFLTLGTHRIPLALWHQDDDAPRHLVTYGAYSRIRHPFYTAFMLAFLAAFVFFPHWGTLFALVYAGLVLNHTAAGEEVRLSASRFGAEYRKYRTRTGRFLPRPRAAGRSVPSLPTS